MRTETVLCFMLVLLTVVKSVSFRRQQHGREKRQQQDLKVTALRIQNILDAHNKLRRMEISTDMNMLTWHTGMAAEAQQMVEDCVWAQRPRSELKDLVEGFSRVAQNIYMSPNLTSMEAVAATWAGEKHHYQYQTGQCNKMCWNYKQVVWAKTHSLGCGIQYCPVLQNVQPEQGGYLIACMYGPAGNIGNRRPYTHGDVPCNNCTSDFPYCYDGLCSKIEPPPEPNTSTTTTTTTTTPTSTTKTSTTQGTTTRKVTVGSSSRTRPFIVGYVCMFLLARLLSRLLG